MYHKRKQFIIIIYLETSTKAIIRRYNLFRGLDLPTFLKYLDQKGRIKCTVIISKKKKKKWRILYMMVLRLVQIDRELLLKAAHHNKLQTIEKISSKHVDSETFILTLQCL